MFVHQSVSYRGEEKHEIGTLAGDVQNWAMLIQNYILQVTQIIAVYNSIANCINLTKHYCQQYYLICLSDKNAYTY